MRHDFYNWADDQPIAPHCFPDSMQITADYRDMGPTLECPCGCDGFYILAIFGEDRSIAGYFTDAICSNCWSILKAPTQADGEVFTRPIDYDELIEPGIDEL